MYFEWQLCKWVCIWYVYDVQIVVYHELSMTNSNGIWWWRCRVLVWLRKWRMVHQWEWGGEGSKKTFALIYEKFFVQFYSYQTTKTTKKYSAINHLQKKKIILISIKVGGKNTISLGGRSAIPGYIVVPPGSTVFTFWGNALASWKTKFDSMV